MPLRLLKLISSKLSCLRVCILFQAFGSQQLHWTVRVLVGAQVQKENNIFLTWTEIVRGVLVQVLAALVLANGMEVSTGRAVGAS